MKRHAEGTPGASRGPGGAVRAPGAGGRKTGAPAGQKTRAAGAGTVPGAVVSKRPRLSEENRVLAGARLAEAVVLLIGSVILVLVHARLLTHAGGLWRDEVNSLEMARTPSIAGIVASLRYDSFPILYSLILRVWSSFPWTGGPGGLRVLGTIAGVLTLTLLWVNARGVGRTLPWVSIPVFGFNIVALRAVDALRPYGLGLVFVLLLFGLVWRVAAGPASRAAVLLAAGAAIASVQVLFTNAVFVLAICLAGIAITWRSDRTRAWAILGVGGLAAASLIPYRTPIAQAADWADLNRVPQVLSSIRSALLEALGAPRAAFAWIWIAAVFGAIPFIRAAWSAEDAGARGDLAASLRRDATVYAGATLLIAAPAFLGMLWWAGFPTQPWYYVPLMGLAASALDVLLAPHRTTAALRVIRVLAAAGVIAACLVPVWRDARERRTNMDLVAATLEAKAEPDDLILVNPWFLGVGFHHAYHGQARWMTIPPLSDLRIHRYDLLEDAIESDGAIDPVLAAVTRTLEAGHRIWLVGGLPNPPAGVPVPDVPHAPREGPWPRSAGEYLAADGMRVAAAILPLALAVEPVPVPADDPVSPYETVTVFRITPRPVRIAS